MILYLKILITLWCIGLGLNALCMPFVVGKPRKTYGIHHITGAWINFILFSIACYILLTKV